MTGEDVGARIARALEGVRMAPWRRADVQARLERVVTAARAQNLTREERRDLAAVYGYELGVDEGSLEIRNMRTMLEEAGVPTADHNGEPLSTIRMVEGLLPRTPGGGVSLTPERAAEIRRADG